MKIQWLSVFMLLGCNTDESSPTPEPTPYADLYTDGTRLDVVGCPARALIGCRPFEPSDHMKLIADGEAVPVPVATTDLPPIVDGVLGLFHDGPFGTTLAAPADARVLVAIDDVGSTVTLPRPPVLAAPAHVSRASGTATIRHDLLDGQHDLLVLVMTRCDGNAGDELGELETTLGEYTVDLNRNVPPGAGTCTHEIHVDQIVDLAAAPDLSTRAIAISVATITSDP